MNMVPPHPTWLMPRKCDYFKPLLVFCTNMRTEETNTTAHALHSLTCTACSHLMDKQQSRHDDRAVVGRLTRRLAHFLVRSSCASTNNNPSAAVNARQEPTTPAGRRGSSVHISSDCSVGAAAALRPSPTHPVAPAKAGGAKYVTRRRSKKGGDDNRELRASSYYHGWSSSSTSTDGDGEADTTARSSALFSSRSRSFSTDSSTTDFYNNAATGSSKRRNNNRRIVREKPTSSKSKHQQQHHNNDKNRGAAAVVKRSHDPYADFRSSMAEMIAVRRVRGADALTELLAWYLCLNSPRHHPVILSAFRDIVSSSDRL
jgi:uncharacterized protein (TIGR01568 family)